MENIFRSYCIKATRTRITETQRICPLAELKQKAEAMNTNTGFPFTKHYNQKIWPLFGRGQKASPSKGVISEEFDF